MEWILLFYLVSSWSGGRKWFGKKHSGENYNRGVRPEKGAKVEISGQKVEIANPLMPFVWGFTWFTKIVLVSQFISSREYIFSPLFRESQRGVNWKEIKAEATRVMDKLG